MSALDIITLRAPDFAADPNIDDFIAEAEKETGTVYGDLRDKAVALLVMHWLEMRDRGGTSGMIKSEREGDLSRSYGLSGQTTDDYLSQTAWGLELLDLRRATIFRYGNRFVI